MRQHSPTLENTAALVVLYHPDAALSERLVRIASQVSLLVVVANDGGSAERLGALPGLRVIYLPQIKNAGLGAGLNMGIAAAEAAGFVWCVILDQDTCVDTHLVSTLGETHRQHGQNQEVAILVPNYRSPANGMTAFPEQRPAMSVPIAISSGSVVHIPTWRKIGRFNESFFIEAVDVEFSLRARKWGYILLASGKPLMVHAGGQLRKIHRRGKDIWISEHAPWRYYLQYRNTTWTLLRYLTVDPQWACKIIVGMLRKYLGILRYEANRAAKTNAILRGLFHGLIGRLGNP